MFYLEGRHFWTLQPERACPSPRCPHTRLSLAQLTAVAPDGLWPQPSVRAPPSRPPHNVRAVRRGRRGGSGRDPRPQGPSARGRATCQSAFRRYLVGALDVRIP